MPQSSAQPLQPSFCPHRHPAAIDRHLCQCTRALGPAHLSSQVIPAGVSASSSSTSGRSRKTMQALGSASKALVEPKGLQQQRRQQQWRQQWQQVAATAARRDLVAQPSARGTSAPVHVPRPFCAFGSAAAWRPERLTVKAAAATSKAGDSDAAGGSEDGTYARVVLPTALALLLCNMDRICLRWGGHAGTCWRGCMPSVLLLVGSWSSAAALQIGCFGRLHYVLMTRLIAADCYLPHRPCPAAWPCCPLPRSWAGRRACRVWFSRPSCGATWPPSCWGAPWPTSTEVGPLPLRCAVLTSARSSRKPRAGRQQGFACGPPPPVPGIPAHGTPAGLA